jgi:hypothetical protein
MKTNFIKKTVILGAMALMLLMASAFVTKETTVKTGDDPEYIYLIAYAGNQNNSNNIYISNIIEYQGYDVCGSNYVTTHDFFGKAGEKFMANVEKYNNLDINDWKIQYQMGNGYVSYPYGYYKGFLSRAEAVKAKEKYVSEVRSRGNGAKIFETYFTYKCE